MLLVDTPDERQRTLLIRVRAFGAVAVCLLAATTPEPTVIGSACAAALTLLAVGFSWPRLQEWLHLTASPVLETLLAAGIVGVAVNDLPQAMLYLLVPAFAAGLLMGLVGTVVHLVCALVVIVAVATAMDNPLHVTLSLLSLWLLTAGGSGLLGAWIQQVGDHKQAPDDAYDSARRLLGQLRTVARRLSAGLDPVGIAQQLLVEVSSTLSDRCSAVLIRSEGGVLVPLTFRGADRLTAVSGDDPLVREVWSQESAAYRWSEHGGERALLVGLPLRAGSRILGIMVAEVEAAPSASTLAELQTSLDQHALPLDTALVFDEIRTIATADERRRVAREIHDGIAQEVASLGYVVDELVATSDNEAQRVGLRGLRSELTRMVSELRLSIFDLRSEVSAHTGVSAALSEYVRLVGTKAGMTVHMSLNEAPQRLRIEVETEMLRIAQEAVTNARRHSGAKNLWVTLAVDPPHATLTVTDDGHGIGPARSDSYGLKIMRERAQRIGADLMIASRAEGGTIVDLTLRPDQTGTIPSQPFAIAKSAMADPPSVASATNDIPTAGVHAPGLPDRST